MSLGFSLSDIVVSIQLASEIHYRCFNKTQGAGNRYRQFGRDIESLRQSLEHLHQIIIKANDRFEEDVTAVNTLSEIVGDFKQTLRDCDSLLKDKSKYKSSPANLVDNVVWHASTERDVNSLTKRLQFHMTKVNLITKPLELQLLSSIHHEQQQINKEMAAIKGALTSNHPRISYPINSHSPESSFHIPEELSDRFVEALAVKDLEFFQVRDDLPLKEGFDALAYHFARSTENFEPSPGLGQEVPEEQYLNLVKSRWIIDRLKENPHFLSPDPKSLWAKYIVELEDKVTAQFLRFQQGGLVQPPVDALTRLPDNSFSVWFDEEPSPCLAAVTENGPSDEMILELPLQVAHSRYRSTLTVYRKTDTTLRLISTIKDDQNGNFLVQDSIDINMNYTSLVPAYAASQDGPMVNNNVLLCNQGQDTKCYRLRDPANTADFQRALTGYRVSHEMSNISWHIEFDQFSKSGESGKARLQLWHLKPLPKIQQDQETETVECSSSSSGQTPHSPVDSLNLRRFWTSGTTLPPSSIVTPVNGSRGAGIALTSPEPPILIIFTMHRDRNAFLHLRLDRTLKLEPQKCERCRQQKTTCSRFLIRSTSKKIGSNFKRFTIRRLCSQRNNGQGLDSWNLGCFRYPEHPEFKDLEQLSIKYLSLHFDTPEQGDEFRREFELLEKLRDCDLHHFEGTLNETKYLSNHPRPH